MAPLVSLVGPVTRSDSARQGLALRSAGAGTGRSKASSRVARGFPVAELRLYNTLARRKEPFRPLTAGQAGIYTCGPTVYAPAHIGNLRSYVFPDLLKKLLRVLGYRVTHVINITDVGHLTSNEDTGEDKLERAARQASRSAWEIAAQYTQAYLDDLERLHIEPPDHLPRATGHIAEQIALIRELEARGFTYRTADGIYFDTARFAGYGRLARLRVAGLQGGSRVELGEKRNKTDFALWKLSPPDARRQMEWESPWGRGFPGWHIECSAMSMKYLGRGFDIHTGGSDHIPVHHTNEIAQSEAATGEPFVRCWLHGEHLVLGEDQRMGKSEGNLITLGEVLARGFDPLAYRYLVLNSHYRKYLTFSWPALEAAATALTDLRRVLWEASDRSDTGAPAEAVAEAASDTSCSPREEELLEDLCDDLNTPKALDTLWTAFRDPAASNAEKIGLARYADRVLSLDLFDFSPFQERPLELPGGVGKMIVVGAGLEIPEVIALLVQAHVLARRAKNYVESDRLRDEIKRRGYIVRDRGGDHYEVEPARPGRRS
ncbi:MAG: cysteine--tRNA ligase [Candidatus Lambdaproteobacteria bacterium]|nr:cysteine--tRNA ligase [Candidatus Lambdaproteobacteria bacterium]